MRLFRSIFAAAALALDPQAAISAARIRVPGQRGAVRLGERHNEYGQQHTNPERAAKRRRVAAWGGRRQYLKQIKALRRMRAEVLAD